MRRVSPFTHRARSHAPTRIHAHLHAPLVCNRRVVRICDGQDGTQVKHLLSHPEEAEGRYDPKELQELSATLFELTRELGARAGEVSM